MSVKCNECKFCETKWASPGFGYCKIVLPPWMGQGTDTTFGGGKLISIKPNDSDGCDLGKPGVGLRLDIDVDSML